MKNSIITVARELNQRNIVWAIGGSELLKRYGITSTTNVLDIMVSRESIKDVLSIMDSIGTKQESINEPNYQTDHFEVYMINNQQVNIICNLKSNFVETFAYDFSVNDINVSEYLEEEKIYYSYLIDWYLIYSEVTLTNEVKAIEEYYMNGGFFNNNRFIEKFKGTCRCKKYKIENNI